MTSQEHCAAWKGRARYFERQLRHLEGRLWFSRLDASGEESRGYSRAAHAVAAVLAAVNRNCPTPNEQEVI